MLGVRRSWNRDEHLTVLRYYLQTEFGRFHKSNPEIVAIAKRLDRTPGSIAMKCSNYASLDPKITGTGRKGLDQTSRLDNEVWDFMRSSFEQFEEESAAAAIKSGLNPVNMEPVPSPGNDPGLDSETGLVQENGTESRTSILTRRRQDYFRRAVLAAYRNTCPITGITTPSLLNASHIIPWKANRLRRLDPTNGIALNALHDRAFDRGLISFEDDMTILVSSKLSSTVMSGFARAMLQDIAGQTASRPDRFDPDVVALQYHRDVIFVG